MKRIDSHHHFWEYSPEQYPWISDSMKSIGRDFLPKQLLAETQASQIDGVISVQARQSVAETTWLLEQADGHDWIRGVVGWLPLGELDTRETMALFHDQRKLCGLRHVVQDEPDDGFLASSEFNAGVRAMQEFGWTYDILIYARQLPFSIPFVDRHPDQVFVVDHIAKPTILAGVFDAAWSRDFGELAKRPNVFCKFSGVATEVRGESWNVAMIQPYWDHALKAFGAERLMFGTDWPVCLLKTSYADWVATVGQLASGLSATEQEHFWYRNAMRAYRLTF